MHRSSSAEPKTDKACPYPVAELLPHAPPMVLLDEVLAWNHECVHVGVLIRAGIPFFTPNHGVPAHVGIEYMAQACGAYVGLEARNDGRPIRLGFLLGTRNFSSTVDWFAPGIRLIVNAILIYRHESMGMFDCRILDNDVVIASAQLNVYQPENAPEPSTVR